MPHANWTGNTVFRVSQMALASGQSIVNVFHFQATDTFEATLTTDALAQTASATLASDFRTNASTGIRSCLPSLYVQQRVRCQVVERPGFKDKALLAVDDVTGMPATGTTAGSVEVMSSAAVIKWRGVVAGRHSRGRTYLGPLSASDTGDGLVTAVTNFTNLITSILGRYTGAGAGVTAGFRFVIYSRPYDAPNGAYTVRVPGSGLTVVNNTTDYDGHTEPVTTGALDTTLRSQRRREIGVGS